ncbi:hypothetical protein [Parasphingorhabdus sp.]|uniref:hypothetical protein n=1 Tax=Parasphingorhabdus sp. TaxID=2709688 RepID=UPI0032635A40
MQSRLIRFVVLAVSFSAGVSCSESGDLPTIADTDADSNCDCMLEGNCLIPEMTEGTSEDRGFECQWSGESKNAAVCSYETRFDFDDPEIPDRDWSAASVDFKKTDDGRWCWIDLG